MQKRNNLILCAVGAQQVGKTTQTRKDIICHYIKGGKALIFTPNEELPLQAYHSKEILHFAGLMKKQGIPVKINLDRYKKNPKKTWPIKRLPYNAAVDQAKRVAGIVAYSKAKGYGIRRISPLLDPKSGISSMPMSVEQKRRVAKDILAFFSPKQGGARNGLVLLDDINNYVLNMHSDEEFVGTFMNINHRGCDYVIHYHDVMQIPPALYRFGGIIRLHKTVNKITKSKKIESSYQLLKIAENVVLEQAKTNARFFIYVDESRGRIIGATKNQYVKGCEKYLQKHPTVATPYGSFDRCIKEELLEYWQK